MIKPIDVIVWSAFCVYLCGSIKANDQIYNVTKCFVCQERAHIDCLEAEYIQECPRTYNGCQGKVIIMDNDQRRFERNCALLAVCESLKDDWLTNGFCHGNEGSMCVDCCHGDLCNNYDPTERLAGEGSSLTSSHFVILALLRFLIGYIVA